MAVRGECQRVSVQTGTGGVCVLTLAAMGAVGQVLRTDSEALFVFLCGAVGGCIVARAFCYGHFVI